MFSDRYVKHCDIILCLVYLFRSYTTISNARQKRRYKEEFYANYDEYCRLHSKVVVIANRFNSLYEQLQGHRKSGNLTESKVS